jgi:hypothetical protein
VANVAVGNPLKSPFRTSHRLSVDRADIERVMARHQGKRLRLDQFTAALVCSWLAASALASDGNKTSPVSSTVVASNVGCDQSDCCTVELLRHPPLSFSLGRAFHGRVGGFARLDVIHDFDAIGDRYEFLTTSIPTDGSTGSRTTVSARQTRFNLDVHHANDSLRLFAEGDFFGPGGDFRLRHAYGEFHGLMVGQNWSAFQDESIIPNTLDYEGPVGMVFVRQPQLRVTFSPIDQYELAFAIEDASQSDSNVSLPFPGRDDHRLPDFIGRVRYETPSGHVQLASVLRDVGFDGDIVSGQHVTGWGMSLSGALHPGECDRLYAQTAFGEGFARYIEDLDGTGSDAALDWNGALVSLPAIGAFVGWNHRFTEHLQSNLVYGFARISNSAGQASDAFHRSEYFSGNMIWTPSPKLDLGLEALWGSRQDKNGAHGEAVRLQFSTTYRF